MAVQTTEKGMAVSNHVESSEDAPQTMEGSKYEVSEEQDISPAEGRKIIHKLDRRLVSATGLMFAISLMDRTNLGNANIAGMSKELELKVGVRYSLCVLLFFVPYIIFQWPSAILAKKIGPRYFLPGVCVTWGIVMTCTGFINSWKELAAMRVLIGIFEAGLFPGALFLLQVWYTRYEVHKRYGTFYLISILGSSFSGVLAFAFQQMAGVNGWLGWRWIFIWEGVLTVLIAILGFFLIIDFPEKAQNSRNFLKPYELEYVIRRLNKDRGEVGVEPAFNLKEYLKSALDIKIWAFGFVFTLNTLQSYSISFFLPLILNNKLGFSVGISQLMSTPPYIFTAFWIFGQAWFGDKFHLRGPIIIANSLASVVGLCLLAWTESPGSQYFGTFLVCGATNSSIATVMAWQANNIRGLWKRAFASAALITLGGTGGIIGALVFRSQDAPQYFPGMYACLTACALTILIVSSLDLHFVRMNKKVDRGEVTIEGLEGFKYTI